MYPDLPYPGYSWPITQHMGVITPKSLFHILFAAARFRDLDDPAIPINNYLIANGILTNDVRVDSGQPEAWRDYQQILSELGLIFSTEIVPQITPTSLGEAFLDRHLSFDELITLQAFRYQYPNGHKEQVSPPQRRALDGTAWHAGLGLARLQATAGVLLRPAVLIWRVIRGLESRGSPASLTTEEIQQYLMRCATHADTDRCIDALINARTGHTIFVSGGKRQRRNAQDWIKFLSYSPLFEKHRRGNSLWISAFGNGHANEIDEVCTVLETPSSFWNPAPGMPHQRLTREERLSWYNVFGRLDLGIPLVPETSPAEGGEPPDEVEGEEPVLGLDPTTGLADRAYDLGVPGRAPADGGTIIATYDAGLLDRATLAHDQMVRMIATVSAQKGATVRYGRIDLLVEYRNHEFIVEVKSVTRRNFVARLRYAIGQLFQYEYGRSLESTLPNSKVIAITAYLPPSSPWIPFINNHLRFELVVLEGSSLKVYSYSDLARKLFE